LNVVNQFIKNTENLDDDYLCEDNYFEGGDKHYELKDEENNDYKDNNQDLEKNI
jgi:hypothetical protein